MLSMPKRFTVTLDEADYAELRQLAYLHEVQPAVEARNLIRAQIRLLQEDKTSTEEK